MKRLTRGLVVLLVLFDATCRAAITFDATNTKLENTSANVLNSADTMTLCAWVFETGQGEGSVGRVIQLDETDGAGSGIAWRINFANNIHHLFAKFATTTGDWAWTATNSQWNAVAISYDKSGTSNNPTVRVNFTNVTVTPVTPPVGTKPATATGYCVGNVTGQTATFDGRIAFVQVFNVVLTAGEMDQAMQRPGSVRRGLRLYLPMFNASDTGDLSGNAFNATATSAAIGDGPPCSPAGGQ